MYIWVSSSPCSGVMLTPNRMYSIAPNKIRASSRRLRMSRDPLPVHEVVKQQNLPGQRHQHIWHQVPPPAPQEHGGRDEAREQHQDVAHDTFKLRPLQGKAIVIADKQNNDRAPGIECVGRLEPD